MTASRKHQRTLAFSARSENAAVLAKEFQPKFDVEDLLNLPVRFIFPKSMTEGTRT
jgi:hypothetical protein